MNAIEIIVNDQKVEAQAGQSVLAACQGAGVEIPTLCALKGLGDVGACRLCMVELEGTPKLFPACTLQAAPNQRIRTDSEKLRRYRRMIVELLFSERNHVCSVCNVNGDCELQELGYRVGMDHVRFPFLNPSCQLDASHEKFVIDHNRCVLCTRCVRVCNEVEGAYVWGVAGRGVGSRIACEMDRAWGNASACTNCGKCVQVCPTGALAEKGFAAEEMVKRQDLVERLATIRGTMNPGGAR
jgi:bidirectional [NiFe] hydrogenase diaphorase subunit